MLLAVVAAAPADCLNPILIIYYVQGESLC